MTKTPLVLALLAAACGSKTSSTSDPAGSAGSGSGAGSGSSGTVVITNPVDDGIDLRVSDGKQGAPGYDHAKLAPATKLGDADANVLLKRAPAIKSDVDDQKAFALRPRSTPPPRTGTTITSSFPAPPSTLLPPKANDAGKDLTVLRFMPEGNVPIAPELSVTFSQPMVAVTSQTDASTTTPVKLTPQPQGGHWRWLGTRTVVFDPDVRFKQATTYNVEIPAGTKSASGAQLAKAVKFTFETPAPTLVSHYPTSSSTYRTDVPMFVLFDQKVDAQAVLGHIAVKANGTVVATTLLDAKAIADSKDPALQQLATAATKDEQAGRWLAFKSSQPLPTNAFIEIVVDKGTPSAEGPNPTKAPQTFTFRTYPPFEIEKSDCGYSDDCRPGMPFVFQTNNPIDPDKVDDQIVTVSPAIDGMRVIGQYQNLLVIGATKPRTHYKVTVSSKLNDQFGQHLKDDVTKSFDVGDANPTFFGPSGMVVLDPSAKGRTLDFFTTNYDELKVKLYKVSPGDYDGFTNYLRNQWNHDHPPTMPGTLVSSTSVKTDGGKNLLGETHVDLSAALAGGLGHVVAIVEPSPWKESYPAPKMIAWVQSTKLGLDAHVDNDAMIVYASDLATGKPAKGVPVELRPWGITGTTDDAGIAKLTLANTAQTGSQLIIAHRENDLAMLGDENYSWNGGGNWWHHAMPTTIAWYVTDDRQMYKPGEEVTLKGWLRTIDPGKEGDVGPINGVTSVAYTVFDSQNNQIGTGKAMVNAIGGFDTKFSLPKTPNLGYARVAFHTEGAMASQFMHGFQIQEFRRPEFEVSAQASQGPFVVGGSGDITVSAKYYSGGPLSGAPVNWNVMAQQTVFTPPNRSDFTFGQWTPWWGYREAYSDDDMYRPGKPPKTWNLQSKTDATGNHVMHLDFLGVKPAMPMSVIANVNVTDVNRQAWASNATVMVHPSSLYVGVRAKKPFVDKGQPFPIDIIGVDLDGKAVPNAKIDVKAVRLDWAWEHGRYKSKEVDPQTCKATATAKDPVACELTTPHGGTYELTATITDDKGRANTTKMQFWVTGGERVPARDVQKEMVQVIPDKKDYAPGDTAQLLVMSPFYPAEGLVTWRRSGIVKSERITLDGPTKVVQVPITDAMTPNLYVQIDVVGAAARLDDNNNPDPSLPKRPAFAAGTINLPIPPKQRTLDVAVTPAAAKLSPGEKTTLSVIVKDSAGNPVPNAEAAVIVVDESILALTGYQFVDPVNLFYGGRAPGASDVYSRTYVKLAKPVAAGFAANSNGINRGAMGGAVAQSAPGAGGPPPASPAAVAEMDAAPADGSTTPRRDQFAHAKLEKQEERGGEDERKQAGQSQQPQAIAVRSNFNPLAAFAPAVKTGADGKASVDVKVPDNLTRYRIIAIAVAGDRQFGKGESAVTARLPLMVRPSPPRFLNFGDTFKLPIVVQNQTDSPMTVRVAIRTTNAQITDGAGRELTVPANDRLEVQFPAAAEMAGTARIQVVGMAGTYTDAAEVALPVWTPATTEAFATYGTIDTGAIKQPVALPGKVVTQFGGLEVTTSSTNLQSLTDAVLYLVHYPFDCAEQRSSRIQAIAALKDVLAAFKTKDMPSAAAMSSSIADDLEHLSQMQNSDGGFAYWDRGYPSEPYLTVYVTNALVHAKAKGFTVAPAILDRAKEYLRVIESHYPSFYGKAIREAISAFALYTRKQMGDLDIAKGQKLLRDAGGVTKVEMETNGWLLGLFAGNASAEAERTAIMRHALNKVSETAGAANFTTSYGDGAYLILSSDRRVDGVMLESLIQEQKDSDLIPKLVTGLLAHRKAGRWTNTQESAFVIQALDLYFNTYEKTTPDFVARVWLGDDYAGDKTFKGRSTDYYQINIPMKDVATHDKSDLTIQKDGAGRLYYRVGMTYAPASLKLEPADYGFVVQREYEPIDDPKDVTRAADGTWHVKAGARVRVRIKMVNENRRYHVALVDPMPAGFEAMNPALATTGPIPLDPKDQASRGAYWWWYGPWYEHQNLRDERVEAFASMLWEGVHGYDYVARATTPGSYVVPPPKAEEMYMPETFGRGGTDRVIVE